MSWIAGGPPKPRPAATARRSPTVHLWASRSVAVSDGAILAVGVRRRMEEEALLPIEIITSEPPALVDRAAAAHQRQRLLTHQEARTAIGDLDGHPPLPLAEARSKRARPVNPNKEFVKALRACDSIEKLHELIDRQELTSLDHQAVTALASFASDHVSGGARRTAAKGRLPLAQLQRMMRTVWLPLFRSQLLRMDATGLCICLQSAAKVARGHDECDGPFKGSERVSLLSEGDFEAVMDAADGNLDAFSSRSAAQLLWGMVTLGCKPPAAWLLRFLDRAALPARALAATGCSPRDLSVVLWCLAKLGRCPPERLAFRLLDAIAARMNRFEGRELGMVLWSAATLRLR